MVPYWNNSTQGVSTVTWSSILLYMDDIHINIYGDNVSLRVQNCVWKEY